MRILDTDHCVAVLRGRLDLQGRIPPEEQLAVTTITVAELTHGAWRSMRRSQNLAAVDTLLSAVTIFSPLITHNRQHFDRIPNLQTEDWL